MKHFARIEISKKNLLSNIEQVKKFVSNFSESPQIAAVVKSNAYGHGVKEFVSILENEVDYFQVDDILELSEIREYTKKPVLMFGFLTEDQLEDFVDLDATLGIYDLEMAEKLNDVAERKEKVVSVHLKIDSFLGRQGILIDEAEEFLNKIKDFKNLKLEAIYSHFSNIEDTDHLDHARLQFEGLMKVKEAAKNLGFEDIKHHISATSGILTNDEGNWDGMIVRLGIGMYGLWPSESLKERYEDKIKLLPVMRWVTKIAQVKTVPADYPIGYGCTYTTDRETKIAVIPQGYSDGYGRLFSNNSEVLIGGKRCPVLGRIAMNMFVVDVSNVEDVKREDEVVLLGKQGDDEITAEELADRSQTINYEITTKVWPKLERVVV